MTAIWECGQREIVPCNPSVPSWSIELFHGFEVRNDPALTVSRGIGPTPQSTTRYNEEAMARQLEAVYEQGMLRPLKPLLLREHQHVHLTLEEKPAEAKLADGGAAHVNSKALSWKSPEPANERREEMKWPAQESSPYAGEWVAIQGPRLIAHGTKLADVSAAAKAAGVDDPFFASVPEDLDMPFAGW